MTTRRAVSMPVRLSETNLRDLRLLKIAWRKKSFDAVVTVLLKDHQLDKIAAIDIEIPEKGV